MSQVKMLSRRRFLVCGCGALCAAMLGGCANSNGQGNATGSCPFGEVNDPYPGKCHRYTDKNNDGFCDLSTLSASGTPLQTPVTELVVTPAATPSVAPTATRTVARPEATATLVVQSQAVSTRCPRGLVNDPYPGRCRHYTDRNGNGICDLSEPG